MCADTEPVSSTACEGHTVHADALLAALAKARRRKEQAVRDMRLLLAYAREIAAPRPYRLADLAQAAGMSISGIRTAYTPSDIQHASQLLNGNPGCDNRRHIEAAVTALLTAPEQHTPACGEPAQHTQIIRSIT